MNDSIEPYTISRLHRYFASRSHPRKQLREPLRPPPSAQIMFNATETRYLKFVSGIPPPKLRV